MKNLVKLCDSIIRKNKGFTLCAIIMSILSIALELLGANFRPRSNVAIFNFLSESGAPDAIYLTEIIDSSVTDSINKIDSISLMNLLQFMDYI